jgi:flotillin
VSAFKPMIDKILQEAGFPAGPDALSSLTTALAAQQLATSDKPPVGANGGQPPVAAIAETPSEPAPSARQ